MARPYTKYNYKTVSKIFKDAGCTLLTTFYHSTIQKLDYVCICGEHAIVEFRHFKIGGRCSECRNARMLATTLANNNGIHHFKTKEFLEDRDKKMTMRYGVPNALQCQKIKKQREKTNLKRYGEKHVSKVPAIRERQKQGLKDKYGTNSPMNVPGAKEKFKKTLLERYGVPSLAYLSGCSSKQSQKLFQAVQQCLPKGIQGKSHFAALNAEFVINVKDDYYKFDFVNSETKKCIEFNGTKFHPRPEQKDNETGWCVFHPNLTVKQARDRERRKYDALQRRGYQILTVWDHEMKDLATLVEKCTKFVQAK